MFLDPPSNHDGYFEYVMYVMYVEGAE